MSDLTLCEQWLSALQASGYRLTRPLSVLVELLTSSKRALGPVELYDLGREAYPKLGLVTVYRALAKLEELGLIQRVHQSDGCHTYLRAPRGHQHILLCTRCGQTVFFSGDHLETLIAETAQRSGFTIQDHWLQLNGLCAACKD